MVNSLVTENMDLESRISAIERKFGDMEKTIQEMRKTKIDSTRFFQLGIPFSRESSIDLAWSLIS
jgi:hypothetical protein